MEPFFNASQTILDFLTLLEVERAKGKSELIDEKAWQDLKQLDLILQTIDKPHQIADAILDWCEKYPEINRIFNQKDWQKVRCDMVEDENSEIDPAPPSGEADIIRNRDKIQKIIQDPDNNLASNPES
ncbi:hypothetical protein PN499_21380 [Kamptonema animale CS-326]|jgi:hypothetical protein|uniref:hypothetical protein n=1 Tax=Kamptonema animale TaxID=92934 RepID=UPI00232DE407|nr:hypothetical protein [Kamptonema animale]MDB9513753.1 hypothetical protein [Kamptonema animale CS-326]